MKVYQAVERHLKANPSFADQFPNFSAAQKPILARGSRLPLEGELHSAQYFHGRDGLGNISTRHPELDVDSTVIQSHPQLEISDRTGVEVAFDLIESHATRTITYLALGPLTTLAHLVRTKGEQFRERIGRIVSMGGALDVPGNTSPMAEFNFFADPYAVKELLLSNLPNQGLPLERFLLLPLDITTPHELPFPVYKSDVDPAFESTAHPSDLTEKSHLIHFTSSFLERTREIMLEFGKDAMELHDIVAVWCAIQNPPTHDNHLANGWVAKKRVFDIERKGELTRGMLVTDRRDDQSAYAPGVNRAEAQKELEKSACMCSKWLTSNVLPSQAEIEHTSQENTATKTGILCVIETPGPETLLRLLLARVWGVNEKCISGDSHE